jgi:hypothetical protein
MFIAGYRIDFERLLMEPDFKTLQREPQFMDLVRRVGLVTAPPPK